ncbi:hypothetical protein [Streptomyces sp. SID12488]|nr:hypothetical protein [Streptomyces sp. SID12488]NEA64020.1 hypothetical protein [Streptomyces sp. SID12488]
MFTLDAHAATSPGEHFVPTTVKRRGTGSHKAAQPIIRHLTRPGAMP